MLVKIKGIHRVRRKLASGLCRTHYYAWRGGPRMKAAPHTEAFALEHAEHVRAASANPTNTLADLIDYFTGPEDNRNPDFTALAASTQRDYLYAYRLIKGKWPGLPVRLTQQRGMRQEIREWHRGFAANPRKADKILSALSKAFSYAVENEMIDKNPCTGIRLLYRGTRKDAIWTPPQIAAFRAHAPAHALLAFEMALGTGQRQGDLLRLTWADYDGIYLRLRQSKGGARIRVKAHSRLKAMLDRTERRAVTILANSRGRSWTESGFRATWGKVCARIEIEGVTFHDLRGTFITERRREGSTAEQIASISGHSLSQVRSVLERHYLAKDQTVSDAVILRMER